MQLSALGVKLSAGQAPSPANWWKINLVMGIVKLALIVLAMVFSAAPLPFSDQLGSDAMHVVLLGAALFYLVASDLLSGGAAQGLRRVLADVSRIGRRRSYSIP